MAKSRFITYNDFGNHPDSRYWSAYFRAATVVCPDCGAGLDRWCRVKSPLRKGADPRGFGIHESRLALYLMTKQ